MAEDVQHLGNAERRLKELLESAPDAIIEFDEEGRVVLVNRMAERLFGYKREELLGQTVESLIPEALRGGHIRHRAKYASHPVTRPMGAGLKLRARRRDGSNFPVEISLSPTKSESGIHVTAIVRDVTERKQIEDQLRAVQEKYIRELELRTRESEQANRLKTEFLANMSHELRSPLHTIIGFAELLAEESLGPLNEKQKRFMNHIHSDSLHLLDLINDLLNLSKIESGRLELNRESFEIRSIVEEVLYSVRPRASEKSIDVASSLTDPITISADRLRFRQILHNLLSNAVKFTPPGGKVRVGAIRREPFAEISVSDTGIGIPQEQHHAVFDKFYQVRSSTKGGSDGTGLGLAITKRLVEEHGGSIWLKSEPGVGSCFTFSVPLEQFHTGKAAG
ncbi:MAG TPA: PAS domain-containing sensor histidine kinase [Bryobacteraceae bacterium]|nr:PAS domain-containing sensor histidine kinase [Bryobacteraceae bacterium]